MNEDVHPGQAYRSALEAFQKARSEYRQLRESYLGFQAGARAGSSSTDEARDTLEELKRSLAEALSEIKETHDQLRKLLVQKPQAWKLYLESLDLERNQYELESQLRKLRSQSTAQTPSDPTPPRQSLDLLAARIMLQESRSQTLKAESESHQKRRQRWEIMEEIQALGPLEFQKWCQQELLLYREITPEHPSEIAIEQVELKNQVETIQKMITEKANQLEVQREAATDLLEGSGFEDDL